MPRPKLTRKLACVVSGAEVDLDSLVVSYSPLRGERGEIRDRIVLGPDGDIGVVNGVGRFLRILRAGRVRAPSHPYGLHEDLESAAQLVRRCRGATVELQVKRRLERALTVWTESGVERILNVLDFHEESDALTVQRLGGQSLLRIPRESLIRYEAATIESLEVVSVDLP